MCFAMVLLSLACSKRAQPSFCFRHISACFTSANIFCAHKSKFVRRRRGDDCHALGRRASHENESRARHTFVRVRVHERVPSSRIVTISEKCRRSDALRCDAGSSTWPLLGAELLFAPRGGHFRRNCFTRIFSLFISVRNWRNDFLAFAIGKRRLYTA